MADALSRLGLKDNPDFKDMLEQCNFYEHQILAVEAQEWMDHCADYNNEVMAANDTPVIKTMRPSFHTRMYTHTKNFLAMLQNYQIYRPKLRKKK